MIPVDFSSQGTFRGSALTGYRKYTYSLPGHLVPRYNLSQAPPFPQAGPAQLHPRDGNNCTWGHGRDPCVGA